MSNLGLVSVSFRSCTPEVILEAMQKAGLSVIEWGSDIHVPFDNVDHLNRIVALQNQYGIVCSSYGTYFRVGCNPSEEIHAYISAAKLLGTRVLRIWSGSKGSLKISAEEKDNLFAECKKLAKIAEDEGVILCTEFHGGTFTDTAESTLELLETIGSKNFKTYWQPNQNRSFEENLRSAQMVSAYTEKIHVFNWAGEQKKPLLEAQTQWREYLSQFAREKDALLEFMPDGRIETLKTEADALRRISEDL